MRTWVDWFIGDITGNFIVLPTWYVVKKSILGYKNETARDIFNSALKHIVDYKTALIGIMVIVVMIP